MSDEAVIMTRRWLAVQKTSEGGVSHAWGPFDTETAAATFNPPPGTDDRAAVEVIPLLQPAVWAELEELPAAVGVD
jgi:hypothetical protein